MKLVLQPPRQGVLWVQRAFRIFARQPLGFASVFAACLFVFLVFGLVPVIGTIVLLVLPPAGTLLFMIATRLGQDGKPPMPAAFAVLARAGKPRLIELLKLGIVYAVSTFFVFWIAGVIDGGALESFLDSLPDAKTTTQSAAVTFADPRLQLGLILRGAFAALLSVPFWHAPALVYWGRQSALKALFFSSVAVWRNKGAFLMYGLAWAALWVVLLVLVSFGVGLFGPARFTLVATPMTLVFSTIFYASLYYTFADCFSPTTDTETRS